MRSGNRQLIRDINRSLVLNLIKNRGPISRTDIARLSGLSLATVSGITSDLIAENLVYEKEEGESTGGRRPILLALNHRARYVIGIKLMEHQITAALTDLNAAVLHRITSPLEDGQDVSRTVEALAETVEGLADRAGIEWEKMVGVGIGLAGVIDSVRGVCRYSPILNWRHVPLRDLLEERIQIPVYIDNDVNTLTMAEKLLGIGQGIDDFLTVTVGRGVGMGIVVNGQFYRGARGAGGEFGHTVIDPEGPLCSCGKRGCLEAYVSDPAIVRMAQEAVQRGELPIVPTELSAERVVALAQEGNDTARRILSHAGHVLGMGIANLINVFNPSLIIVTGEGVRAGDMLFGPMRDAVQRYEFANLAEDTEIVVQEWGDDAWARGAASLVLQEIFKPPVYESEPVSLAVSVS
ncbi:MAG: ROK family transcriptional regulator [Anaerolineae bacterium]|nr:ROK family transcriptional regulator [Anaerolineae bacterium]